MRRRNRLDALIGRGDRLLRAAAGIGLAGTRDYPAKTLPEDRLNEAEMRHAAGLMRVNHVGEVCAQALYVSQALLARNQATEASLVRAAREEGDHLLWCEQRLDELHARPSRLNPLWFGGAATLGLLAATAGDASSLGFVEETERQVVAHLEGHLDKLPQTDTRSRAIVQQMRDDEARHAAQAEADGARPLPMLIRKMMACQARIMTTLAYWI